MDEQDLICPVCGHENPPEARFCQNDGVALQDGDIDDPLFGRMVGNYRLKERVGEGGFGVVYRAEHREMGAEYAVKILHPQFSANAHVAERFRREAAAAGRLRHENVVHIADFGQAQGVGYFYVMEFLQGKTLKEVLDDEEAFPPSRILHIARQVTSSMERVHELNIIHRDLKPENIFLITKNNQTDHVKLVDFGIAKVMDGGASITRTGLSVGTPLYMSPEQARGLLRDLDRRSDIYSWGVILFELLTYQPPFFSENPHDVVMLQIRATPPRLSDTHPYRRFSEPIEEFFRRILSKNREDRPSTMTEVYEQLEPLLLAPDAFHDVETAGEYHSSAAHSAAELEEIHTMVPREKKPPQGGTDPGLYAPLSGDDMLADDAIHHEEGTSIDSLPALSADDLDEVTQIQRKPVRIEPVEATSIAPRPQFEAMGTDEASVVTDAAVAGSEGELLTESEGAHPFVGEPPLEGPPVSDSLDNIFDGLPLANPTGEVVANLRTGGVSPSDTSEAMWGTATAGSMATDPNALHSPFQRYWWAFATGFVLFLGLVFWLTRTPKQTRKPSLVQTPSATADAGVARRTPDARAIGAVAKRPLPTRPAQPAQPPQPTPPNPRVPDAKPKDGEPIVKPLQIAPMRLMNKRKVKLVMRSNPRAKCYRGPRSKSRYVGRTPCTIRALEGDEVYLRLERKGYSSLIRIWSAKWNAKGNEVWVLTLRKRRRRRRTRRRPPPRPRVVVRPPPRRRGGGDVFNQTPNPFKDKKKKKKK